MRVELENIPKMWGKEVILYAGEYCAKLLKYAGPYTSSEHYHVEKHETFIVVDGEFEIEWYHKDHPSQKNKQLFGVGKILVLPPDTVHRVKCLSPEGGTIFEASSIEDPDDCVRLKPSVNPCG